MDSSSSKADQIVAPSGNNLSWRQRPLETIDSKKPQAGQIWILPAYDDVPADSKIKAAESHRETYGHPVVIKSVDGEDAIFCTITSFNGKPLREQADGMHPTILANCRFLKSRQSRDQGVQWEHPQGYASLQLAGFCGMQKPSYARLDKHLVIEWKNLSEYNNARTRLDDASLEVVRQHQIPAVGESEYLSRPTSWGSNRSSSWGSTTPLSARTSASSISSIGSWRRQDDSSAGSSPPTSRTPPLPSSTAKAFSPAKCTPYKSGAVDWSAIGDRRREMAKSAARQAMLTCAV